MFDKRYKSHHDIKDVIENLIKKNIVTPFTFNKMMNKQPDTKEAGIYVHTPYCDKICAFCNMNRKQVDSDLSTYVDYLCREFEKYGSKTYIQGKTITSIFFGGGTPTIYRAPQLEKILSTLRENFILSEDCEFTFETTLHNLTSEKLAIMEKYGVNRISVGIQTFSDRGREVLNRTYKKEEIVKRLKKIREEFHGLICIDIIYNYLDETLEEVENDGKLAVELGVDSISFYSLMIHEGSKISKDLAENRAKFDYQIKKDKELHDKFLDITLNNGYKLLEHTKISNGRDKYRYIRNINSFSDLFAIGVGAGGRIKDVEYYNLNKFITFYSKDSDLKLRAKKISGILQYPEVKLEDIKRLTSENAYNEIVKLLKGYEKDGLLKFDNDIFKYTISGVFWGNSIDAEVVSKMIEIEKNGGAR